MKKSKKNWENLSDPTKIIETLLGKVEVIRHWCCEYYKEILEEW